jgi:hypothetical protein
MLRCADGSSIALDLVSKPGDTSGAPVLFFQNASDWIVHVSYDVPAIAGPAELDLDVTVTIAGKDFRERATIRIVPAVRRSSGIRFASA